jgi:hypothetical protein
MKITLELSEEKSIDIEWKQKIPKLKDYFLFDGMIYFTHIIIWNYTNVDNIKIYKPTIVVYDKNDEKSHLNKKLYLSGLVN